MIALINYKKKYIIIEVYKNGSRTLRDYFLNTDDPDYKCEKVNYKKIKDKRMYSVLVFVRNPYARVVSCYLSKIINPPPKIKRKQLDPFGLTPNMTFEEFVHFLVKNPKGRDGNDPHWASQDSLIPQKLLFVGRMESFYDDLKRFLKIQGIKDPKQPKHLNYTTNEGSHYTQGLRYADKPKDQGSVDFMSYYKEQTLKLIQKRYKRDFERFGYEM